MTDIGTRIGKMTGYFGGSLVVVPWLLFLLCYFLNPQWVLTRDALSSFGDPSFSQFPWVYNYGLAIIALIIWLMSLGIVATAENKVQVFGGTFWFVAGIFLALIGYYHGGTYPHDFVSTWFFAQAALAMSVMGLGSYFSHDVRGAVVPIILAILMPLGAVLVSFPSAATTEIYEIVVIDAWALFSISNQRRVAKAIREGPDNFNKPISKGSTILVASLSMCFFGLAAAVIMLSFI